MPADASRCQGESQSRKKTLSAQLAVWFAGRHRCVVFLACGYEAPLPLGVQADLLGISRSSLYYRPRPSSAEEVALKHRIDAIYTQYPFYGSRRIAAHLRREGVSVNRKAVQRHMREMGIAGICPGPNLSRRAHGEQVYPYLLGNVRASYPNHFW